MPKPTAKDNNNIKRDKSLDKPNYSRNQLDNDATISSEQNMATTNVIPAIEERFTLAKKTIVDDLKIEKKWISTIKKIEVPARFEEVFINDKEIESYQKDDGILSKVKDRIMESFDDEDKKPTMQYLVSEQQTYPRGTLIPLFNDYDNNKETEKVIPIFGEEIVVSKRVVKLGEVVIRKWKVTENKKIDIDVEKEKISIEFPDDTKRQITPSS
jgi:stress response protein YsnF